MKLLVAMSLLLFLTPILQAKKPSHPKTLKTTDLKQSLNSFLTSNAFFIILTAILLTVVVYFIYDYLQKQKVYNLLQSIKQATPEPVDSVIKPNRQVNQINSQLKVTVDSEFPIYKIVITGGPCGGKTTGLDRIKKEMTEKGFRVFSIPQIPTVVFNAGGMILMSKFSTEQRIKFQSLLIKYQIYTEDYFTKLAEMSKSPSIIICDRGTVDPYAYISKEEFQAIMDEEGWSWTTLRDRRYDRVVFMNSAAVGAEDFYTKSNNAARSQGLEAARALNQKTLDAWTGHPHLSIIANIKGESFNDKMTHAVHTVEQTVGLQMVNVSHQKFLIELPVFPSDLKVQISEIEQGFLVNEDPRYAEDSIKKRGQDNSFTYQRKYRTARNENGDCVQQIRKPLTALQYVTLKETALDQKFNFVKRKRILFACNDLSYAIDIYDEVKGQKNVHLLRFNSENKDSISQIPDFIRVVNNVKKDKSYSLREIARKQ